MLKTQVNTLISVIIPLFNREEYILETIDSVIEQTHTNWELIIVDDGSIDNSYKVVAEKAKADARIFLYKRDKEPKGAPTSRNIGIEKSKGEYIQFLDSDDLLANDKFEKQLAIFSENSELDFVGCQTSVFVGDKSNIVRLWSQIPNEKDSFNNILSQYLSSNSAWQTAALIWKKTFLNKIKGFDIRLTCSQEWELHGRALVFKSNFSFINENLVYFRGNSDGAMGRVFTEKPQRESLFLATTLVWKLIKEKKRLSKEVCRAYRITSITLMIIFIQERLDNLLNLAFKELLDTKSFFIKLKYLFLLLPIYTIHKRTGKGKNFFISFLKKLQKKEKQLHT